MSAITTCSFPALVGRPPLDRLPYEFAYAHLGIMTLSGGGIVKTRGKAPTKKTRAKAKTTRPSQSRKEEALVLVGTMKGAFVLRSDKSRRKW